MEFTLHDYQRLAFKSEKQIILFIAGIQSGKTTLGALWTLYQTAKYSEPNSNFIVTAPTYKVLEQSTLPAFRKVAKLAGGYKKGDAVFELSKDRKIFFRTGTDPESLEGITNVMAIWGDEAGNLTRYFFENMMGRAAFKQAQVLLTTTPYAMNWLSDIARDATTGKRNDCDLINCRSIDSPYFPKDEYKRQSKLLDPRRFRMKYEGIFGQMEGLVYDCIESDDIYIDSIALPPQTNYYAGIDWGFNDPFAMSVIAHAPDGTFYQVAEFVKSGLTPSDMVRIAKARQSLYNIRCFYCDPSRPDLIQEFNKNKLNSLGSENDIKQGIAVMYELFKTRKLKIFKDMCPNTIDELSTYHYPERIDLKRDQHNKDWDLPVDQGNHSVDNLRYGIIELTGRASRIFTPKIVDQISGRPKDQQARIEWLKRGGTSQRQYKLDN